MNTVDYRLLNNIKSSYGCLCIFILGLIFISACDSPKQSQELDSKTEVNEESFKIPKGNVKLDKPLVISTQPKDKALCQNINKTIKSSGFTKSRWGIIAISLQDGRIVCERNGQKLFNPASIQKLLTSIVALDKLGKDFRWKTSVYSNSSIENGIINGDMILYGQGSPDFDEKQLNSLVKQLKQKGLTRVTGNIIGDESYFKGDNLGDGWTWNAAQWYYGAASSALSINQNQARVSIKNGKPNSDLKYVELTSDLRPIEDIEAIGLKRELGTNNVHVWGNGNSLNVRIAISKPALLSAKIFKETLEKQGVIIEGKATNANWRTDNKLNTANANEVVSIQSRKISEVIRKMNKDSVNFYAEIILKTLGKKFGKEAPSDNPKMQKLRGVDSAGASVIKKWLGDNNIAANETAIHDGSGLSRLNHVTPESIGRALVYASQSKFADVFNTSLPVSGQSGTLRGRLGGVTGKVLGKTGSITYVNSLAGFAKNSNETLAFVVIGNNITGKGKSSQIIDELILNLVKH